MASAHSRVRRLVVGLVGAGLAVLLLGAAARAAASAARILGRHAGVALTQDQVAVAHRDASGFVRPVPRIIHHVFHNPAAPANETLPADGAGLRRSCLALHPTWEHKLWTAAASRRFIQTEYPWFLDTYDGFRSPAQRVDTLRYFLLRHFGGISMGLANGCRANLEPLLYYPAWVTDGGYGTLDNRVMGAEPEHPFWLLVTDSLVPRVGGAGRPYVSISHATGRWFETEMWQIYHAQKPQRNPDLVRVMMDPRPKGAPWVFFTAGRGGTGDGWDHRVLGWAGNHRFEATLYGLAGLGAVAAVAYAAGRAILGRRAAARGREWERLPGP